MASFIFLLLLFFVFIVHAREYPVPLPPGGRNSVHGWLILPVDQDATPLPSAPVGAWFVHHTPEFWTDSPHNFQIILYGTMLPLATVNNVTEYIPLPYPPSSPLLVNEFTITPPGPFSLNDLLTGQITTLYGAVYNGSFDTSYERYAIALAALEVESLTVAEYLNISSAVVPLENLQYYQFPRSQQPTSDGTYHLYLSHQIKAAPDFDQVIHVVVPTQSCTVEGTGCNVNELLAEAGQIWVFPNTTNDVAHRLMAPATLMPTLSTQDCAITCKMAVLEEIHCVVGPGFSDTC